MLIINGIFGGSYLMHKCMCMYIKQRLPISFYVCPSNVSMNELYNNEKAGINEVIKSVFTLLLLMLLMIIMMMMMMYN